MPRNNHNEMNTRAAAVSGSTLNEESRTIEAVISTEQPVAVYDYRSRRIIDEVLVARGGNFPAQVPLFDDHFASSFSQLGSARNLTQRGGEWSATIHFAKEAGERRESAWQMVRQGHVTDVSIGYRYGNKDFVEIGPGQSKVVGGIEYTAQERTLRVVTRWDGIEVSTTPIGADDLAKMRSQENLELDTEHPAPGVDNPDSPLRSEHRNENESTRSSESEMPKKQETGETEGARNETPNEAPAVKVVDNSAIDAARKEERERISFINSYRGKVSDEVLTRAVDEGMSVEQARAVILEDVFTNGRRDEQRNEAEATDVPGGHTLSGSRGNDAAREGRVLAAALLLRSGISVEDSVLSGPAAQQMLRARGVNASWVVDAANGLRSAGTLGDYEQIFDEAYRRQAMPMRDFVRAALELEGVRCSSFDEGELMQRAMSSATVGNMFSLAFNARLMAGFAGVDDTTASWCGTDTLPNYQSAERFQMGKYARLTQRKRGGTPEHGTIDSKGESIRVYEYASKFIIDEQDLVDNTFGNIGQLTPEQMGEAAAELAPDLAYATLLSNPTMSQDSTALFHADHANLNASSALTYANLIAARADFATRTDPSTKRHIKVTGDVLLVPEALRGTADELVSPMAKIEGTTGYNANAGKHTVTSDPRLDVGAHNPETGSLVAGSATSWYLASRGGRYGISLGYLAGRGKAPRSRRLANVLDGYAIGWVIDHVVGCSALGYEGLQKNNA